MEEWNILKLHQSCIRIYLMGYILMIHKFIMDVHVVEFRKTFFSIKASIHSTITLRQINTNRRNFSCHVFIFITPEKKCVIFYLFYIFFMGR